MPIFASLLAQLVAALVIIKVARDKHEKCSWNSSRVNRNLILASLGLLISQVLPIRAAFGSPLALACVILQWVSLYKLAMAIFRWVDLRKEAAI